MILAWIIFGLVVVSAVLFGLWRSAAMDLEDANEIINVLREGNLSLRSEIFRAQKLLEKKEVLENEIDEETSGSNDDLANAFRGLYNDEPSGS